MKTPNHNPGLADLLSALSAGLTEEELLLSAIQAEIAAAITARRVSLGLSQKELAAELQVSQSLVSKWESGETNFTLETLVKLALTLDLKLKSPFVPAGPFPYYSTGNVVPFPGGWSTGASKGGRWTQFSSKTPAYALEM